MLEAVKAEAQSASSSSAAAAGSEAKPERTRDSRGPSRAASDVPSRSGTRGPRKVLLKAAPKRSAVERPPEEKRRPPSPDLAAPDLMRVTNEIKENYVTFMENNPQQWRLIARRRTSNRDTGEVLADEENVQELTKEQLYRELEKPCRLKVELWFSD